jgi:hypothetical protein
VCESLLDVRGQGSRMERFEGWVTLEGQTKFDGQGLRVRSSNGGAMSGRRVAPCFAAVSREGAARGLL